MASIGPRPGLPTSETARRASKVTSGIAAPRRARSARPGLANVDERHELGWVSASTDEKPAVSFRESHASTRRRVDQQHSMDQESSHFRLFRNP